MQSTNGMSLEELLQVPISFCANLPATLFPLLSTTLDLAKGSDIPEWTTAEFSKITPLLSSSIQYAHFSQLPLVAPE